MAVYRRAAAQNIRSHDFETYARLLLLTAMRPDREALNMRWRQVDFDNQWIMMGKSKTAAGEGRIIPTNDELFTLLRSHADLYKTRLGQLDPDHFLFPRRKPAPADPTHHIGSFKKAWGAACDAAGLDIRLYDCRQPMLTKLAESGASDSKDHGNRRALVTKDAGTVQSYKDESQASGDGVGTERTGADGLGKDPAPCKSPYDFQRRSRTSLASHW